MPRRVALLAAVIVLASAALPGTALGQQQAIAINIPAQFPINFPAVSPSSCWKVARPADGRITAQVVGPGNWSLCIGDASCPMKCGGALRSASTEPLTKGPSYFVKVETQTPGVTATLSIYPTAGGAPPPVAGTDLRGSWTWTCCRGLHGGTFQITTQNADGTFAGRFGDTPDDGRSPFSGRLTAGGVEFTRTILAVNQNQLWKATLSGAAASARMTNGTWSGFGFSPGVGDFQAARTGTPPAPPTLTLSIVGRWNWTCCKGASSGSFTISEHDADGRIRGVFGITSDDGATPFDGTYSAGQLVFTRVLTINGARQQQVWRARITGSGSSLRTTDGQFSGFGAVAGLTDIQAVFVGGR